jgi:hypothetical protein
LGFFTRTISLVLIALITITIAYAVYRNMRPSKVQIPGGAA